MPPGAALVMTLSKAIILQFNKCLCVLSSYRNYFLDNGGERGVIIRSHKNEQLCPSVVQNMNKRRKQMSYTTVCVEIQYLWQ